MIKQSPETDVGTVASDLPKGVALLADLATNLTSVRAGFEALTEKVRDGNLKTSKGLSLLELKNQSFLSYMTNLSYLTLRKLKGLKIEKDSSIERLVEHRVLLERIRPLEDKLKYQIDKYIKVATEGVVSADDPSQLKGNLDNIGSSSDEDEDDAEQMLSSKKKDGKDDGQGVYKIPKITQARFDEGDKGEAAKERAKKHLLKSSMIRDALYEHTEDPEEIYNIDVLKQKSIRKRKELETHEEDHMMRKVVSRSERASMRQVTTLGTLGSEMLSFNSLNPLHDDQDPSGPSASKKQRTGGPKAAKGKKGKTKGKKGFKKRRKH